MSEELEWLVYSREHNAFWRPSASGYTWDINAAGRYTKADADKHCDTRDPQFDGGPSEIAVIAPEAAADRDHWKGQAEKNHKQTLEAMQENDRLREKLRTVLPMAKGYASKNNVGRNREKIEEAEVILGNRIETASKRILRDPSRSKKSKTNFSKSLSQALPRALKETSGDQDGS